jgi:protein SCO1
MIANRLHERKHVATSVSEWTIIHSLTLAATMLLWAGCAKQSPAPAADAEKHYPLTGEVVSVDAARKVLVVHHDPVPGFMPMSMTMEFPVSAGDAAAVKPGENIRADLVVDAHGNGRLEKIWPDDRVAEELVEAGARKLREDTHERGDGAFREVGESMPEFALYDQSGRVVQSDRFRGKLVMLNFIYSRCPFANMCPLSTQKMMATQKMAREAGIKNIEFVSITLDPAYDTPGVLKEYAAARNIDTSNFSFLTGPDGAIRDLLAQFGVIAQFEGDILKHTLATLLIDTKGRIVWRADGSEWEPQDFVERMHRG